MSKELTMDEAKQFIQWAKVSGIESFTLGDLSVKFSPYALQGPAPILAELTEEELAKQREKEFESVLFHSSTGL